jgi:Cysteine rich repeat
LTFYDGHEATEMNANAQSRHLSWVLVVSTALLTLTVQQATAQALTPVQAFAARESCRVDYWRFCRGVPPGGGRIVICLNAHADQLSEACFQTLTVLGLEFAATLKACQPDYNRMCANVPPGFGRGLDCLMRNADALSAACRAALEGGEPFDAPPEPPSRGGKLQP